MASPSRGSKGHRTERLGPGPGIRSTSHGLAGRELDVGAIRSAIAASSASSGTVLISGEAGVGTTAIVSAVVGDHEGASVQVSIRGAATPPYGPVADLLRALLRSRLDSAHNCAGRLIGGYFQKREILGFSFGSRR